MQHYNKLEELPSMKKEPRKASREVDLEDIITNAFLYESNALLDPLIRGHLTCDALISEALVKFYKPTKVWRMSFPKKVQKCEAHGILKEHTGVALNILNDIRNDVAHIFGKTFTPQEIHAFARKLEVAGVEFSDGMGVQSFEYASASYDGAVGMLAECLWCLGFQVALEIKDSGHGDIFSV